MVWWAVLRAVLPDATLKVTGVTAQIMLAIALAIGTPCLVLSGWLSDKIGRKPIMLAGFALAVVTYFPIFQGITHFSNPKLEHALAAAPVTVTAPIQPSARSSSRRPAPRIHHGPATSSRPRWSNCR